MKYVWPLLGIVVFALVLFVCGYFYSYVFAKTVEGKVVTVTKVVENGFSSNTQVAFAFAVAIKSDEEIITASSEDRQWSVVKEGMCAKAKFFPYPFWDMEKGNTYFNARLLKVWECP